MEPTRLELKKRELSGAEPTAVGRTRLKPISFDPILIELTRLEPAIDELTRVEPTVFEPTRVEPSGFEPT